MLKTRHNNKYFYIPLFVVAGLDVVSSADPSAKHWQAVPGVTTYMHNFFDK